MNSIVRDLTPLLTVPLYALSLLGGCAASQTDTQRILPLKRLRLYETGVGYFERTGVIASGATAMLPVPAGHVDDALKTLTVSAPGGKAIVSGVAFASNLSRGMARALSGLDPAGRGRVSFEEVLMGLRGEQLHLTLKKGSLAGVLVDIRRAAKGGTTPAASKAAFAPQLLVVDRQARLHKLWLHEVVSYRPEDAALQQRLKTALAALTKSGRQKRRALRVLTKAQGPITLGYIAETPLARLSYRLVRNAGSPLQVLQGWMLIHNDSDEDWRHVSLSLISGRPDSFLFPLTVPRYLRRPLVHPKRALASVPQLINTTPDAMWGDQLAVGDAIGMGGLGLMGHGSGGGGYGRGYGRGVGRVGSRVSATLKVGNLAAFAKATGKKAGTLFHYQMSQPIDLSAHSSASLPFTQTELKTERITSFEAIGQSARVTTVLENSTGQTLPAGTIAFYADGAFVGESFLPRTKPGQRHFLTHGTDQDLTLSASQRDSSEEVRKVEARAGGGYGYLQEHYLRKQRLTLRFKNRDSEARQVYLRLNVVKNAKIEGADGLDYHRDSARSFALFSVPKLAEVERKLVITEGLSRSLDPLRMDGERLELLSRHQALPGTTRTKLTELLKSRLELQKQQQALTACTSQIRQISERLKRLRKHLAALGVKSGPSAGPFISRVLAEEDALATNQKKEGALKMEIEQKEKEMRKLVKHF